MQSTSRDLLVFATALADGTLLSPESQAAMQTFLPAEDLSQFGIDHGYGLGLERYAMDDMTLIGHLGTGETGSSYFGYDADAAPPSPSPPTRPSPGRRRSWRSKPSPPSTRTGEPNRLCTPGRRPPVSNSGSLSGRLRSRAITTDPHY